MNDDLRSRRVVLAGAGAAGLAAVLSGCTVYGDSPAPSDPGGPPAAPPAAADSPGAAASGAAGSPDPGGRDAVGGGTGGRDLAGTGDIPVGGGKVFPDEGVVVTQPQAGTFKAFSATCTHQGCQVESVSNGTINCPCHGSRFRVADGSVAGGPAKRALPGRKLSVDGDRIQLP